ncbi:MAG: phosphatase PAP2 family protein [Syntrophobacteraceae bacterium]|nr:phosphatase PAP2 family protein [Syntrophobacteraceae bacterium]
MSGFFYRLPRNLLQCFKGYNLLWHALAIVLTYLIVASGLDWRYFLATRLEALHGFAFSAVRLGMVLPVLVPLILLAAGSLCGFPKIGTTAFALGQAALSGLVVSSLYKVFTGRIAPPHAFSHSSLIDSSHGFRLGFLRGGMFWGWPSSHTTVAFAMSAAIWELYPQSRAIRYFAILYAIYIGVGVSITIHWFSEFVAGAIIGSVIGAVVGKSFRSFESTANRE